jgi:hypothetical protein
MEKADKKPVPLSGCLCLGKNNFLQEFASKNRIIPKK